MNKEKEFETELNQQRAQARQKEDDQETVSAQDNSKREININTAEWIIVLLAAIVVDIVDLLDLTGFGAIIARIIDIPMLLAVWAFILIKLQQMPSPRKDPIYMLFAAFIGELSPIGMIGFWTLYIIYLWLRRKKIGRAAITHGAKKMRKKRKFTKALTKFKK